MQRKRNVAFAPPKSSNRTPRSVEKYSSPPQKRLRPGVNALHVEAALL